MPNNHAVLAYIPETRENSKYFENVKTREDFYNMPLLKAMAKRFPELDFYIVANTGKNDDAKLLNIH